jgi:hypothetical protein
MLIVIHNVYMYRDSGELLYHEDYRSISEEIDPVVVSGFFSAIQSFGKTMTGDESDIKEIDTEKFLITFSRDPDFGVTVALVVDPEDRNWTGTAILQLLTLVKEKLRGFPESLFITELPLKSLKGFDEEVDKIIRQFVDKAISQKKKVIPILLKKNNIKVSLEQSQILNLVDGERSISEIADLLNLLYFRIMMICLDLKKRGIIDTKEIF